jgi:hypothetical protein
MIRYIQSLQTYIKLEAENKTVLGFYGIGYSVDESAPVNYIINKSGFESLCFAKEGQRQSINSIWYTVRKGKWVQE